MAKERLGVDARNFVDALNEVGVQVRKLGIDKVAAKAGLKPSIVKKFVADAMKSKTSDIRKIRNAVNEMLFPDEQPSRKTDGDTDEPSP
jgi:hypothetical protein